MGAIFTVCLHPQEMPSRYVGDNANSCSLYNRLCYLLFNIRRAVDKAAKSDAAAVARSR